MLGQERLALGIGSCRQQALKEVAEIARWLQAFGLGCLMRKYGLFEAPAPLGWLENRQF